MESVGSQIRDDTSAPPEAGEVSPLCRRPPQLGLQICGGENRCEPSWKWREDVGFKTNKHYDVEAVPVALDAWFGFWGPAGGQRQDYELRFYPAHEDAVAHGTALADEGTGEDAKLLEKDNPTWTEGLKERRRSATVTDTSGASGQDAVSPGARYADYSIYGNVILLCAGANPDHSLERCNQLIDALEAAESSG